MVRGFRAAMSWDGLGGEFVASVPELPGCWARGTTRTETLGALADSIGRHTDAAAPCDDRPVN